MIFILFYFKYFAFENPEGPTKDWMVEKRAASSGKREGEIPKEDTPLPVCLCVWMF